ncbi:MAG: tetratricopeptide repeat protein [Rivularia sp. (in: cyanobacteria)]
MNYQELNLNYSEIEINKLHQKALELYHNKQLNDAENKFKEVLELDFFHAAAWLNIGTLYYTTERYSEALDALNNSLYIDSSTAIIHYSIGLVLEKLDNIPQAIQAYQQAIILDSQWIDAYNQLGKILCKIGNLNAAESVYIEAIKVNPKYFNSYLNLGNVLLEQDRIDEAIVAYEQALELKPRDSYILYNLGIAFEAKNDDAEAALNYGYSYYRQGKYEEAIEQYEKFLAIKVGDIFFYVALAECYKQINKTENAIAVYEQALSLYPQSNLLCFHLIGLLQYCGKIQKAIALAQKINKSRPDVLTFKLEEQRLLPILYDKEEDIEFYRQKFINSLELLTQNTSLDTPEAKNSALEGINYRTNFYLQYQGKNDVELQKKYGQFVHQVMAINYPEWVQPISIRSLKKNDKIRIGYISNCLRAHTVGKLMLGWLRNRNYDEFETYCYYFDKNIDFISQQFRLYSNYFYHIPEDFKGLCNQILTDKLDILVFLDIGMHPQMTTMAGLRLAPVQCTTWGHPITSGIPTVDYFLSCELMEPKNAQQHYSEKLISLPNIGISYRKPVIPKPEKSRLQFGLRNEAVVYLSCQSLFKYLPQYDYIFPAIAQKVPQAQFAFISHGSAHITEIFRKRLKDAFAKLNLNSEDYCVISPRIGWDDYCNLNQISDVFLDTFSWSGGNTTLEAIACNLPIVTCPGEFMRGRHSYGILQMLGVTDTIAKTEAEYIEIAVKLGQDSNWRNSLVKRMLERHSYLYDDKTCVEALEDFYRSVVQTSLISKSNQ